MRLLDEETQLATKRRTNIDYLPGMISVLSGEEMLVRGARTVWEALALVPGISQGMEFTGERQVLARGVEHGYASGQVKILLDGQSMNSAKEHRKRKRVRRPPRSRRAGCFVAGRAGARA